MPNRVEGSLNIEKDRSRNSSRCQAIPGGLGGPQELELRGMSSPEPKSRIMNNIELTKFRM